MIGSSDWYRQWLERITGATLTLGLLVVELVYPVQFNMRFIAGIGIVLLATLVVPLVAWPLLALCAQVSRKRRRRRPSLIPPTVTSTGRSHVTVVAATVPTSHK